MRNETSDLNEVTQGTASAIKDAAYRGSQKVTETADSAMSSIGNKMSSFGTTIKEKVSRDSTLGSTATTVADQLEASGKYLQEHGVEDLTNEMRDTIRRHPMQSLWVGLGIGVLIGSILSRRQ